MRKILNLLFDTFHGTKYFQVLLYHAFCPFCVCCCSGPNAVKFIWYASLALVSYCNFLRFFCAVEINVAIQT
jgi:hypothetical protein